MKQVKRHGLLNIYHVGGENMPLHLLMMLSNASLRNEYDRVGFVFVS